MGVDGSDLRVSCAKVKNVSKLALEGQRLEAKEQVVGVSLVKGTSREVDGVVGNRRRCVGTVVGGKLAGFGSNKQGG